MVSLGVSIAKECLLAVMNHLYKILQRLLPHFLIQADGKVVPGVTKFPAAYLLHIAAGFEPCPDCLSLIFYGLRFVYGMSAHFPDVITCTSATIQPIGFNAVEDEIIPEYVFFLGGRYTSILEPDAEVWFLVFS